MKKGCELGVRAHYCKPPLGPRRRERNSKENRGSHACKLTGLEGRRLGLGGPLVAFVYRGSECGLALRRLHPSLHTACSSLAPLRLWACHPLQKPRGAHLRRAASLRPTSGPTSGPTWSPSARRAQARSNDEDGAGQAVRHFAL